MRAEADRPSPLARQVELAGHAARHRVVVDLKRVAQALEIAPRDAEPRVDLVAAVRPRSHERKQAVGADLRVAETHDAVG